MDTKERRRPEGKKQPTQRRPAQRRSSQTAVTQQKPAQKRTRKSAVTASRGNSATRTRSQTATTKRRQSRNKPSPDVVYVQPAPFNKTRFVLSLLIVVAVVLAVIFGMHIFFKVDADKITVSGTEKYTPWQIREASGIKDGENLLSVNAPRISSNIKKELPYVNKVRIGIKLPDTVKIEIEELDVVYSVEDVDGNWWLLRSDGYIVEKTNSADAEQHTKILGVKLTQPVQGQAATAYQPIKTGEDGETEPVTVRASDQLATALSIVQYLEDLRMIGDAKSVDVTNIGDLQLWYGDRYQVVLGDSLELPRKIKEMKGAIDQMSNYQSGVLDVSFTIWPDEVGYTPFS